MGFLCMEVQKTNQQPSSHTLYGTVKYLLVSDIRHGPLTIQQWTPQYGSVGLGYTITQADEIAITGIPCPLCTPEIIEYAQLIWRTHGVGPWEAQIKRYWQVQFSVHFT